MSWIYIDIIHREWACASLLLKSLAQKRSGVSAEFSLASKWATKVGQVHFIFRRASSSVVSAVGPFASSYTLSRTFPLECSQGELLFSRADGSEHREIFTTLTGFFADWTECCNLNKESHVSSTKEIQLNGGLYWAIGALFLTSDLMWLHSVSCGCKPCFRGGACMHRVPFRGWIIEYFNILYLSWNEAFLSRTSQRKLKRSRIQAKFHRQKKVQFSQSRWDSFHFKVHWVLVIILFSVKSIQPRCFSCSGVFPAMSCMPIRWRWWGVWPGPPELKCCSVKHFVVFTRACKMCFICLVVILKLGLFEI